MAATEKKIASISISGEVTLNLHSLNNEGGEGNQIMTRQVTVLDKEGREHTVNGISGDMFKHISVGHLINYCDDNKLPLCEGCKIANPNRISLDSQFIGILKGIDPEQFSEEDNASYQDLINKLSELQDEKSKEYKDILKAIKIIIDKYIFLKITDETDLKEYNDCNVIIEIKIGKKNEEGYLDRKKKQDDAKKRKKEIESKYNLNFSDAEKISKLLDLCTVDDIHGVLVTAEKNNLPRKSVIEFAWTVGIPGKNNTETYLHTKVVADAGAKGSGTGSNEGQNIFHRPANHGAYAFICNIDVYRIGLNDITREYAILDKERKERYNAVIQSILSTILNPRGAMTSSQKPHITDFKGVVTISHKLIPAPTVSAINPDYQKEITEIVKNLNIIEDGAIEKETFNGLGEFSKIMMTLCNNEPYKLG